MELHPNFDMGDACCLATGRWVCSGYTGARGVTGMNLGDIGRMLVGIGLLIMVVGGLLILAGRIGLPLGRLPGDVSYRGKNFSFFAPLGTSLLLSVLLSLIFYVLSRFRR
jgi:hypothetical protein